ncbi:MAG TPA: hypothetical protein VE467_02635 [Chryseolinea sp.]|nr:hypothetical protein [Chryseolinea sp.]
MALRTLTCEPFRSWNRLEPRPRASAFDRVLKAEVHDPLWMLTRQWQFGEFQGEDTGSAVFAKVQIETTRVTKLRNKDGVVVAYDESIPLETRVERMPILYDLRFRARAGQFWLKVLASFGETYNAGSPAVVYNHAAMKEALIKTFAFSLPTLDHENDSTHLQVAKAKLLSNKEAHQALTALGGRSLDGVAWYEALTSGTSVVIPSSISTHPAFNAAFSQFMLSAATEYVTWFDTSHEHPAEENTSSWQGSNLEYSFACSMPNKGNVNNTILEAKEYYQGHLDWYSFDLNLRDDGSGLGDLDPADEGANVKTEVLTIIPAEARFGGMPNSRWWEFEDGSTDFGNITADTTDLAKILLAEFALMYSNDWFVIPYTVPAGSVSEVKGIIVTDTFGERTLIEPAGQGDSNDWTAWTMFNLTKTSDSEGLEGKIDPRIYIPPVVSKAQESKPLEAVEIMRDEMANMVWGVEKTIPDLLGGGADGHAAAQLFSNFLRGLERNDQEEPSAIPEGVKLKFNLGNTVPENWIPFLPIHLPGQNRAIQLQRASMPRWYNGEFTQTRPRTSILRFGMHEDPSAAEHLFVNASAENQDDPYFIFEEESPRSGVIVQATWQRTRWYNGKIVCWYGRRKQTSRGEGSSGLAFDTIINVDFENQEALVPAEE